MKDKTKMTAQLESTTKFLAAKRTLLNAMRHHAILGSLKDSKVSAILGYDYKAIAPTESQIEDIITAEEQVETELKYWESWSNVCDAKTALLAESRETIQFFTTPSQAKLINELYGKIDQFPCHRDRLVNLVITWGGE